MAETIGCPLALFDYLLYHECASSDWADGGAAKRGVGTTTPSGTLMNHIKWAIPGANGTGENFATKCGIIASTWKSFYESYGTKYKLISGELKDMRQADWKNYVLHKWHEYGCDTAAHISIGIIIFQGKWGGWASIESDLSKYKAKATISGYKFKTSGTAAVRIADASHAFTNPSDAYMALRDIRITHMYNLSALSNKNGSGYLYNNYRVGWMRREYGFQPEGLFITPSGNPFSGDTARNWSMEQWQQNCDAQKKTNKSYKKLVDWGFGTKTTIATCNEYADPDDYTYSSGDGSTSSTGATGNTSGLHADETIVEMPGSIYFTNR